MKAAVRAGMLCTLVPHPAPRRSLSPALLEACDVAEDLCERIAARWRFDIIPLNEARRWAWMIRSKGALDASVARRL